MSKTRKQAPRFKVGDWVTFLAGTKYAFAQIIEDRGCIGAKGRRLYRIERPFHDQEPDRFEMPEEYLEPAEPPVNAVPTS